MKYLLYWLIVPIFWTLGGYGKIWPYRYWRRAFVPLVLSILTWPIIKWWVILQYGLIFGSATLGYGDDPTDKPRWLCGLLYTFPLIIVCFFTNKWILFMEALIFSSLGSHFVNNILNGFLHTKHKDRITEALTAFCAYWTVPFLI